MPDSDCSWRERHFAPRPAVRRPATQQGLPQIRSGPLPRSLRPRGLPPSLSPGLACPCGPTGLGGPSFGTGGSPPCSPSPLPSRLAPKCLLGKVRLTLSKAVPGGLSLLKGFPCRSVGCLVAKAAAAVFRLLGSLYSLEPVSPGRGQWEHRASRRCAADVWGISPAGWLQGARRVSSVSAGSLQRFLRPVP